MTEVALRAQFNNDFTPPVNDSFLITKNLNALLDFALSKSADQFPDWNSALVFNPDASGAGKYCKYSDTNGNKRLFETRVFGNSGNQPPSDPNINENTYWKVISQAGAITFPEWQPGVYGSGLIIVFYADNLYKLTNPVRPFTSANIETETALGSWKNITAGGDAHVSVSRLLYATPGSPPAVTTWDWGKDSFNIGILIADYSSISIDTVNQVNGAQGILFVRKAIAGDVTLSIPNADIVNGTAASSTILLTGDTNTLFRIDFFKTAAGSFSVASNPGVIYSKLLHVSENTVFAKSGNTLYKSVDGGLSFANIYTTSDTEIVDFDIVGNDGCLITRNQNVGGSDSNFKVLNTSDGGANWSLLTTQLNQSNDFLTCIIHYAVNQYYMGSWTNGLRGSISRWWGFFETFFIATSDDRHPREICRLGSDVWWVFSRNDVNASSMILKKSTLTSFLNSQNGEIANARLESISFATATLGLTVGYNAGNLPVILKSTDGGSNWTSVSILNAIGKLRKVRAVSATSFISIGDNGVIYSVDSGDTWSFYSTPALGVCLSSFNSNSMLIGTLEGKVWKGLVSNLDNIVHLHGAGGSSVEGWKKIGQTDLVGSSTIDGGSDKDLKFENIRDFFITARRAFVVECLVGGVQASVTIDSSMLQLAGTSDLGTSTLGMGGGVLIVQSDQAEPAIDDVTSEFLVSYDLLSYINKKGNGFFTNTAGWLSASAGLDVSDQGGRSFITKDQLTQLLGGVPTQGDTLSKLYDLITSVGEFVGNHNASTGLPTSGSGIDEAIDKGDFWPITTSGTIAGLGTLNIGDVLWAKQANATLASHFFYLPFASMVADASSTVKGISRLYNAIGAQTDGGITPGAIQGAGYVVGAASVPTGSLAVYSNNTGKLIGYVPVFIDASGNINIGSDASAARLIAAAGSSPDIAIVFRPKGGSGVVVASDTALKQISIVHTLLQSRISGGAPGLAFVVSGQTQNPGEAAPPLYLSGGSGATSNDDSADVLISGGSTPLGGTGKSGNVAINGLPLNWLSMQHGTFIADAGAAPSGGNPTAGVFVWPISGKMNFMNASGVIVDIFNLTTYSPAYNPTITFDKDNEVYSNQTGNAVTLTLDATGAVNMKGTILRLNKPASVGFAGVSAEAHPNSMPFDSTKLNQVVMVYHANWGGAGAAKVIYLNTLFTAI